MKEDVGNLWTYPAEGVFITTNGYIKKNGELVMGRGCALEAKQKFPQLPLMLGRAVRSWGNIPMVIYKDSDVLNYNKHLFTFPVKHNWWEQADLNLIKSSANWISRYSFCDSYVLPRTGCGNGQRDWETEVKPILENILDDKFTVIIYG